MANNERLRELGRQVREGEYVAPVDLVADAFGSKVAGYLKRIRETEKITRAQDRHEKRIHEALSGRPISVAT